MIDEAIQIVAAVAVDAEGRVLLVRKRGTLVFMQPGGKLESEEMPIEALRREIAESCLPASRKPRCWAVIKLARQMKQVARSMLSSMK